MFLKHNHNAAADNKMNIKERQASLLKREALSDCIASKNQPILAIAHQITPSKDKNIVGIKANTKHKPPVIITPHLIAF